MRAGLVGDHVRGEVAAQQLGEHVGGVAQQPDRDRLPGLRRLFGPANGFIQRIGLAVQVPRLDPSLDPYWVHLNAQGHAFVHRHCQRLRAAHASKSGGQDDAVLQGAAEPLRAHLAERLERTLHDPLRADVDPRACGHLPVHGQPGPLQLPEGLPVGPLRNQHGVGDQHARRLRGGPKDADRLP